MFAEVITDINAVSREWKEAGSSGNFGLLPHPFLQPMAQFCLSGGTVNQGEVGDSRTGLERRGQRTSKDWEGQELKVDYAVSVGMVKDASREETRENQRSKERVLRFCLLV